MQGKRIFVLKANKARTDHKFHLKGLPSTAGRMDIVCRCISRALLYYGNKPRRDTVFYAVLLGPPQPPKTITIDGAEIEGLRSSEIAIAGLIRESLKCFKKGEEKVMKGIYVNQVGFEDLVSNFAEREYNLIYLHERGKDVREVYFSLNEVYVFILGDHIGLNKEDELLLEKLGVSMVSVGPKSLLGSHCIAIVQNELDRRFSSSRSSSL
ncbi:MAG: tRNA (pseudouridine(54)-N(1))-methyltransferase TrmY [Candidatus Baldrarchaeia archaeon]